jgi:hypothetical protein
MRLFKQHWYKILISFFLAYLISASLFPQVFAFTGPSDCLFHSSLWQKPNCLTQDGYQFIVAPIILIQNFIRNIQQPNSLSGLLVIGFMWYFLAFVLYFLIFLCCCIFWILIVPFIFKKITPRKYKKS